MCMSSQKPQTTVTDPLAAQKQSLANISLSDYVKNIPYADQLLNFGSKQFGNFDFNQPGIPDILRQSNTAQQNLLTQATGATGDTGPYANLKKNLLGTYDTGVQKYTLDPLKEQLIQQGIYSSGPGQDSYANAANQAAQNRALLGSQADVDALNYEQNTITNSSNMGGQIANLLQILGFSNPMAAFQEGQSLQKPPNLQDVATSTYTPPAGPLQQIGQLLGQGLISPVISAIPGGGYSAQSPIQSGVGQVGQSLSGLLGIQSPKTYNTGVNYNPGGGGQNQLMEMLLSSGANIQDLLPLLMAA